MPNVGKSTLFNAITQAGAASENYPFCTIEPNVGMVSVPDARLDYLAEIHHPKKFTPATIEFLDIAGLVKGASKGEGLGNKFLSHIREVDAIVHVVRCFEDENITHVDGNVDPVRDMETISFELIFADMETVEKRLAKAEKMQKSGDKKYVQEAAALKRLYAALESGKPACTVERSDAEQALLRDLFLLTDKPIIYVANISEDELGSPADALPLVAQLKKRLESEQAQLLIISAKVEEELAALPAEEKQLFMQELGIAQSGLDQLVQESYRLLGLISFLTAGEDEVRAWPIRRGTKAPQAAGKIHTDFERGFIKAEVISFDALKEMDGNMQLAREKGLVRQEGKEYIMQDGDVVLFKFNV